MNSSFDLDRFRRLRSDRGLTLAGEPIHWAERTGSTNDDALAAAREGAAGGATFVVEEQTKGRGRYGRSWHSEPGASLLFSVILREPLTFERLACLSLASGVGVRRALGRRLPAQDLLGEVTIKWPNDIWVNEKKLAGILVESVIEANVFRAAVIGVGINVREAVWPEALARTATSISALGGATEREALLVDLLESLTEATGALARRGFDPLALELSRHDALLGRRVRVAETEGVASGIDALGRLCVRTDDGGTTSVSSGTVELCR